MVNRIDEALEFFGDPEMAGSAQGAYEKGQRLAELVGGLIGMALMAGRGGSLKHCAIAPPYPFSVGERLGLDCFPAGQERPAQSV